MRLALLALALCAAVSAQAHLLPAQNATFRLDGDKLYMVLAMTPSVLKNVCEGQPALTAQNFGDCQIALVDFVVDRMALFSSGGPAELLDLRLAPTLSHDDPEHVDQVTALGVFRLPATLDPLFLVLDLYSDEAGADRYDIVVSNSANDGRRRLRIDRLAPITALFDEPIADRQQREVAF